MLDFGSGFEIGPFSDRVTVEVIGRVVTDPDPEQFWDWPWLLTRIKVHAGSFVGELLGAQLMWSEIRRFRVGLETVYDQLTGTARLDSQDRWISLEVEVFGSGHVKVRGEVRDSSGSEHQNALSFAIDDLDQTYLPMLISQLRDVEAQYAIPAKLLEGMGF